MGLVQDQYPAYNLSPGKLLSYLQKLFPGAGGVSVAASLDGNYYILKIPRKLKKCERAYIYDNVRDLNEDEEIF
ncbi:hypothetical protein DL766_000554 [Monosporascus sp. MC13-8B]|uniref:Uncharacterized protein n=1 Tax=Monosporascus cannonballus TaxID=155416 RepID=A0ABY0HAR4_9PEZI|nr:hypothetical protein DL763_009531 [Monosporascus cannonballus]RYO86105.1 hypothetical protein DL762_004900 [Monosporascus cannonballus]RYP39184.1 hypothetical protein DL766_000554 [Monosporascus sp. MC13-8B]